MTTKLTLTLDEAAKAAAPLLRNAASLQDVILSLPRGSTDRLRDALLSDPELQDVWERTWGARGNVQHIQAATAATAFIARAQHHSAAAITSSLYDMVAKRTATVATVVLLKRLSVDSPVRLTDNLEVVPPEQLPVSVSQLGGWSLDPVLGFTQPWRPDAALIHRSRADLVIGRSHISPSEISKAYPDLGEVLRAVTVGSSVAPRFAGQLSYIDNLGWPARRASGMGVASDPPPCSLKPSDTASIRSALSLLEANQGREVRPAIVKLNDALLRRRPEEQIVDIGTCLEMLLMKKEKDQGEITFKLRTRAAWFLGSETEDRRRISKLVRDAYGFRSRAVHGSLKSPTAQEASEHRRIVDETATLCRALIQKILREGWPDWEAVIYGSDAPDPPRT